MGADPVMDLAGSLDALLGLVDRDSGIVQLRFWDEPLEVDHIVKSHLSSGTI